MRRLYESANYNKRNRGEDAHSNLHRIHDVDPDDEPARQTAR